jgi:hypothetical protein
MMKNAIAHQQEPGTDEHDIYQPYSALFNACDKHAHSMGVGARQQGALVPLNECSYCNFEKGNKRCFQEMFGYG